MTETFVLLKCVKVLLHKRSGQTVCARQGLANGKNRNNSIKRYLITGHPYHSFLPPFSSILWRKETMNPPLFSFSLCTCSVKTVWLCSSTCSREKIAVTTNWSENEVKQLCVFNLFQNGHKMMKSKVNLVFSFKVQIIWEGPKIWKHLPLVIEIT